MILNLYLKNFTCFEDCNFSFLDKVDKSVNLAFIYGENGAGKTNIVQAFNFLNITINNLNLIKNHNRADIDKFKLDDLLKRYKKLNSINEEMIIKVDYLFNNKKATYEIRFDDNKITYEELKYEKKKNLSTVYRIDEENWIDDKFVFKNQEIKKDILYNLNKYKGSYSLLAIICDSLANTNLEFINSCVKKDFLDLFENIIDVLVDTNSDDESLIQTKLIQRLVEGEYNPNNLRFVESLRKEEASLTSFYASLYSKIIRLEYKTKLENNKYLYKLFVVEKDGNKQIEVPFDFVSTGTKRLLKLYIELKSLLQGRTIIIDEIDTGIHDLLIKDIVDQLIQYSEENKCGQLIATTHNTFIMNNLNPRQIFIINEDNLGNKEFYRISEFRNYSQKNNNYEKKYHDGAYGGVPYSFFSIESLIDTIEDTIND